MTPEELEQRLRQFQPVPTCFSYKTGLFYTPGIQFLIEEAEAEWLVRAIASYQKDKVIAGRPNLQEFQCWKLLNTHSPILYCHGEWFNSSPEFCRRIRSTAFPLEELELLVVKGCLMLPSEYDGP